MNAQRPVNSLCRSCRRPVLWAVLPQGTPVPLDRSATGPIRLVRGDRLEAVFLGGEDLAIAMQRQREAIDAGEQPEQLYALHPAVCRQAAKAAKNIRRRGRRRTGGRR